MLETVVIDCPYCGERCELLVDASAGSQRYVEDCTVCCRPMEIAIEVDDDGELLQVTAATDSG